jgi:hypothetical protein
MRSRRLCSLALGTPALGLFLCGLCGLCGCPNPNAYTVPRTLTPGDTQFTLAPEVFAYDFKQQNGGSAVGATPTGPSFGFRYGVSDRFDFGARLSSMLSPTVDGKIQLARGAVDVALDPGAQLLYVTLSLTGVTNATSATNQPRALVLDLYAPVLVGFNLSSSLTVVLSPGIGYAFATPLAESKNNSTNAAQAAGFMGRMGFGLDIRYSDQFAIHPEVTVMRVFDPAQSFIGVLGVGFNFGAMPDYSDIDAKK